MHIGARPTFRHLDPGPLTDGELSLVLREAYPGDEEKGYVPAYRFAMRLEGVREDVGIIDLRIGTPDHIVLYGGNIGYGVKPAYRGRGLAARASRLILSLARRHDMDEIWITCNPDNIPSIKTIEKLGAEYIGTVDLPEDHDMYLSGERQKRRYRLRLAP